MTTKPLTDEYEFALAGLGGWQQFTNPPAWEAFGGRYPVGRDGLCYGNAYRLTRCFSELRYVEGEAHPLFDPEAEPLDYKPHAWCVTREGVIVDSTWRNGGVEYEGVLFDRETINRVALETGFWTMTALEWLQAR